MEGTGDFWVFMRGFGWFFKGQPEVPGKEIFSRGLQLVGRIELDQTWLCKNSQQGEERRRVHWGRIFPFGLDNHGGKKSWDGAKAKQVEMEAAGPGQTQQDTHVPPASATPSTAQPGHSGAVTPPRCPHGGLGTPRALSTGTGTTSLLVPFLDFPTLWL